MPSLTRRFPAVLLTAMALAGVVTGCGDSAASGPASGNGLSVVASFYPLQFIAERVAGPDATVTNLTKPGAEPHDLELAPQDVATLANADLVIYLSGFQPAVDDAISTTSTPSLDVTSAANLSLTASDGTVDPHFWLDPMRLADAADAVAAQLSDIDPDAAPTFERNAAKLREDLKALDTSYTEGLRHCDSRLLVTSHSAFGYLADAYGLDQVGITGLTPDTEPTPADLAKVTDVVRDHDVTTIFYETLVSPDVAETVAASTGASTAVLDPLEGLTAQSAGDDYFEVMAANLKALRDGLGCA